MEGSRQPERRMITGDQTGRTPAASTQPSGVFPQYNQALLWPGVTQGQGSRLQDRGAIGINTRSRFQYTPGKMLVTEQERLAGEPEYQGAVQNYPAYELFPASNDSRGDAASTSAQTGRRLMQDFWKPQPPPAPATLTNLPLPSGRRDSVFVEREAVRAHASSPLGAIAMTGEQDVQCCAAGLSGSVTASHMVQFRPPVYTVAKSSGDIVSLSSASAPQRTKPLAQSYTGLAVASEGIHIQRVWTVEELERTFFTETALSEMNVSSGSQSMQPATTIITTIGGNLGRQPVTSQRQASRESSPARVPLGANADAQRFLPILAGLLLPGFRSGRDSGSDGQLRPRMPEPLLPGFRPGIYSGPDGQRPPMMPGSLLPGFRPGIDVMRSRQGSVMHMSLPVRSAPVPAINTASASVFPNDPARQAVFDHISSMQEKEIRANVLKWKPEGGIACSIKSKRERERNTGFSIKFLFRYPHVNSRYYLSVYDDLDELRRRYKFIRVTTYFKEHDVEAYVRREDPRNFKNASLQHDPSIPIYGKRIQLIS